MEDSFNPDDIQFIVVDLFAGAGGVTTGIERASFLDKKVAVVIAAVNHDILAIESHKANHPHAHHFIEDVRTLEMCKLIPIIDTYRKVYKNAKLILWASAECTHFSVAKAGPKDEGSRTLPEALYKYIDAINPSYVLVENVKEFKDWGPCDDNLCPIKDRKGEYFKAWKNEIRSRGYKYSSTIDNAADFGGYTSRIRYFGGFYRPFEKMVHPKRTHSNKADEGLKPHLPVKDVLDLEDHGNCIFAKQKSDNTYRRIYEGLQKHTPQESTFLTQYNGASGSHNILKPCGTLTTKDRFGKIAVSFLDKQYGTGVAQSLDRPSPTLTTNPKVRLVTAQFMDQQYGNSKPRSLDVPSGSLTTTPKQNLVTAQFLDNPQWGGNSWSIDRPCFTLIARMDKAPAGMVTVEQQESRPDIPFLDNDTPYQRKIKEFMILNYIAKISMRMLNIPEMLRIMGFGADYILKGGVTAQKRFIGNAVHCDYAEAWFEALAEVNTPVKVEELQLAS